MRNTGIIIVAWLLVMLLGVAAARAADADLSLCLGAATTIEAGGDVSDKDLAAAHHACEHAKQTPSDTLTRWKVDAAYVTVDDESRKRQPAQRPH
jgi:hypothetical protein